MILERHPFYFSDSYRWRKIPQKETSSKIDHYILQMVLCLQSNCLTFVDYVENPEYSSRKTLDSANLYFTYVN